MGEPLAMAEVSVLGCLSDLKGQTIFFWLWADFLIANIENKEKLSKSYCFLFSVTGGSVIARFNCILEYLFEK